MDEISCQVAVIGAGPSGLAVATELARNGINGVHIFERESSAGGIPRHCSHSPFGFREFKRLLTGKQYTERLKNEAVKAGAHLHLNTSIISIDKEKVLTLATERGVSHCRTDIIILCTGARETPRSARLISGERPVGIFTTGALQSLIAFKGQKPFKRPVIVGNELVTFSAMLTCKIAGIHPIAILNEVDKLNTRSMMRWSAKIFGVDYLSNTKLIAINGKCRVQSVDIENEGSQPSSLECDGVIFTGKFQAENSLSRSTGLIIDQASSSPQVDQYNRSSKGDIYIMGNQLHPVDTAGWCWQQAKNSAAHIAHRIRNPVPQHLLSTVTINLNSSALKFVTPQILSEDSLPDNLLVTLHIRFKHHSSGTLEVSQKGKRLSSKVINARPEKRYLMMINLQEIDFSLDSISISLFPEH